MSDDHAEHLRAHMEGRYGMKLLTAGEPDAWKDGPTVIVHQEWRKTPHGQEYRQWFKGQEPPEWVRWHGERPFTVMHIPADPIMLTNIEAGEIE